MDKIHGNTLSKTLNGMEYMINLSQVTVTVQSADPGPDKECGVHLVQL